MLLSYLKYQGVVDVCLTWVLQAHNAVNPRGHPQGHPQGVPLRGGLGWDEVSATSSR